jgi:hypothetical protein
MPPRRNRFCVSHSPTVWLGRWALGIAVALLATLTVQNAWAQRVVLLRPVRSDAVLTDAFNRLQAELKLQLFEVVVIDSSGADPIKSTATAAHEQNALAAVSLRQQNNGASAELCIVDRATGKTSLRSLALENVQDAPSVLAIRAVDLLRASLREFAPAEAPAPEIGGVERQAPAEVRKVRAWASPTRHRTSARLGVAMLDTSAEITNAYGIDLAVDYDPTPRVRVGLWLMGPLIGARFHSPLGTANLRQEMAALRGAYRLLESGQFELWPSLGFGAYHLAAHADTVPPLASKYGQVSSLLVSAGLAGAVRVVESVALEVQASAILLTPRPGIAVLDYRSLYRLPIVSVTVGIRTHF